jgi:hypothetical protein
MLLLCQLLQVQLLLLGLGLLLAPKLLLLVLLLQALVPLLAQVLLLLLLAAVRCPHLPAPLQGNRETRQVHAWAEE